MTMTDESMNQPNAFIWRPMTTAPRDGRAVLLLYNDLSGVEICRWGFSDADGDSSWFYEDMHDELGDDSKWLGWFPIPHLTFEILSRWDRTDAKATPEPAAPKSEG